MKEVLHLINGSHPAIKFTVEEENDGKLPFLDILIHREDEKVTFSVYRKPTFVPRYITSESYHNPTHKKSAFNSMVYRMVNLPMKPDDYEKEKEEIHKIAQINGFSRRWTNIIIRKMEHQAERRRITTLQPVDKEVKKRISLPYYPSITNELTKKFKNFDIDIVTRSSGKLKSILKNYKHRVTPKDKSGIYEISCDSCPMQYIGQSKRRIVERFREHKKAAENMDTTSAAAEHVIDNPDHNFTDENLRLVKEVNDHRKLDIVESIKIQTSKCQLMNNDFGPCKSLLFRMLK